MCSALLITMEILADMESHSSGFGDTQNHISFPKLKQLDGVNERKEQF